MEKDYTKYLKGREGSRKGTWVIKGETKNAELSGSHYRPELAICEGTLEDVCKYAITLKNFFTWGSGGSVEEVPKKKIIEVNEDLLQKSGFYDIQEQERLKKIQEIEERIADLEDQITSFKDQKNKI